MSGYEEMLTSLLHRLHRGGYPSTKDDITAVNVVQYKKFGCRANACARRAVCKLHAAIQHNKPPLWIQRNHQIMEIFKVVVMDCKQNYKVCDKSDKISHGNGKEKKPLDVVKPEEKPKIVKKPATEAKPVAAPKSPPRPVKKEPKPESNPDAKTEKLFRQIRRLQTKLQAKELEIDELKSRCEARTDRLLVQSDRIHELLQTVEQKNQEIAMLEDQIIQGQMAEQEE